MPVGNYLKTFGNGSDKIFTFPGTQTRLSDTFNRIRTRPLEIPGMSGHIDGYGRGFAPQEIGEVSSSFVLTPLPDGDPDDLQALLDELSLLPGWGTQKLVKACGAAGDRYCYGRVKEIRYTEEPSEATTGMALPVQIDFEVSEPGWFTDGNLASPVTFNLTTSPSNIDTRNYVNNGLRRTYPIITLSFSGGAGSFSSLTVNRTVSTGLDLFIYTETILAAATPTTRVIDCRRGLVYSGATDKFEYLVNFAQPNFLRLEPGTNEITFNASITTLTCAVSIYWAEIY